jgi:hypothetical protein
VFPCSRPRSRCGCHSFSQIVDIQSYDDDDDSGGGGGGGRGRPERCFAIKTHLSDIRLASISSRAHDLVSSVRDCTAYCQALRELTTAKPGFGGGAASSRGR